MDKNLLKGPMDKMLHHGVADGKMMEHEMPMMDPDNVMGQHQFKKGETHPDSKMTGRMHGDGPKGSHYTGHFSTIRSSASLSGLCESFPYPHHSARR